MHFQGALDFYYFQEFHSYKLRSYKEKYFNTCIARSFFSTPAIFRTFADLITSKFKSLVACVCYFAIVHVKAVFSLSDFRSNVSMNNGRGSFAGNF